MAEKMEIEVSKSLVYSVLGLLGVIAIIGGVLWMNSSTGGNIEEEKATFSYFDALPPEIFNEYVEMAQNNESIVIIDVRTPEEYAQGRIEGAINLNIYDPQFREKLNQLDKSKTYLVYCRSGSRSARAKEIMRELGFQKVYDLEGGIIAWRASGLPLV